MNVKGENLSASGNPIRTALAKFVSTKFVFPCINILQYHHFVAFPTFE